MLKLTASRRILIAWYEIFVMMVKAAGAIILALITPKSVIANS